MEKQIKTRFNETILQEAIKRYGIDRNKLKKLDGFESFIFEYEKDGIEYILRIGHSIRRPEYLIQAEADWINFLAEGGASVAKAINSEAGKLVEAIADGEGEFFMCTAFLKIIGDNPWKFGWSDQLFQTYGSVLGKLHFLSKDYKPTTPNCKRPDWDDPIMLEVESFLPESDGLVEQRYRELLEYLNRLPKNRETYGLVHQDVHGSNLLVEEDGTIVLFDFDDSAYSWYMNDIAIVLFYAVMGQKDRTAFSHNFMKHFLLGYQQENIIDPNWLKEIPYFLKLREIDLYAVIHRSFDVNNLDDPWSAGYMKDRKEMIEQEVPYIDFDFESLKEFV